MRIQFSEKQRRHIACVGQPLSLFSPAAENNGGSVAFENGDVHFRIYAPNAENAAISLNLSRRKRIEVLLSKQEDGSFEGVLPYASEWAGAQPLKVLIDGMEVLSPCFPIGWLGNRPCNMVEIPDPGMRDILETRVPRGAVTSLVYDSSVLGRELRCLVYTPPGYLSGSGTYPVLYLLHGGTENELAWLYTYKLSAIMDYLIAEGLAVPCLVVLNNGMVRHRETQNAVWDSAFEQVLIRDCIPLIGREFRVASGKWNRAVAGLSMGAYMSNDIGLGHPELFGYIGQFTGCMYHETDFPDYERPYLRVFEEMAAGPRAFADNYRVFFRSTTPEEDHFDYFEKDDEICEQAGIHSLPCYHRIVYPEGTSKCASWRRGLYDFAQMIFRGD